MASSSSSKDKHNFQCVTEVSLELIKLPLKDILRSQIKPENLFLKIKSSLLLSGRSKLRPDQLKLCYFPPPLLPDYSKFDVTLLYTLIRNLCSGLKPTRGWGNDPDPKDTKIGDDVERLRLFRNKNFAHLNSATIPDDTFEDLWRTLKVVLSRLKSHSGCSVDYEQELIEIKRSQFRYEIWEDYRKLWNVYLEIEKEANERVEPDIRIKGEEQVICGDNVEFKAEVKQADSFSFPIKWQRRKGQFVEIIDTSLEKYSGSTNTNLVIPSVCKEDAFEYQASLSDRNNHTLYSNTINLHVLGEIPILNDLEVTVDDEKIKIHYSVGVSENSPHVRDITWSKNGQPMHIENVKFIGGSLHDNCLIINSPSKDDKGKYSCTITNAVGSETKHIVLDVPCVTIAIKSPVHFASDTTITSTVTSMPPAEKAQWQKCKYANDFSELKVTKSKYFGSNINPECPRLIIPKTTFVDTLYYRLQISNKLGVNVSNTVHLNVTGSLPNITVNHETDINNKSIKLTGVVFLSDDSPCVCEVYWCKNGEQIDIQESGGRLSGVTIDDPSLTIRYISQEDAGKYQLTARNAIGSNTSNAIFIDAPYVYIVSEKYETECNKCMCFLVKISSIPSPCHAQWYFKPKGDDKFTLLDVNDEEYQGSTNSLPHPKLVVKKKDQLEKNLYQVKVTNFVGSTVKNIPDNGEENRNPLLSKHSVVNDKGVGRNIIYSDQGRSFKFAELCYDLAKRFPPEKFQQLKYLLKSSGKVIDVGSLKDADSAWDCFELLQQEKLFTLNDVIFMQFLLKKTDCNDLNAKCVDYAKEQTALCYFTKPPENGYTEVQFHIQGDITHYSKKHINDIVVTVASILHCNHYDILVNGLKHSESFMLLLSIRKSYIWKFVVLDKHDWIKLLKLNIDYVIIEEDKIVLEKSEGMQEAYRARRRLLHRETIHTIRSDAIPYSLVLLERINADFKNYQKKFSLFRLEMLKKAQNLVDLINYLQNNFVNEVVCDFHFKDRRLKHKIELNRHLLRLQKYIHVYEQSAIRPLHFLSCFKTSRLLQTDREEDQFNKNELFSKEDVIMLLSAIQIQMGNRCIENECLLKVMPDPKLLHSLRLTNIQGCDHISCVTSDHVWVSKLNNLILTNKTGVTLHHLKDLCRELYFNGLHTVNNEGELIYIDTNYNINILSKKMKNATTFIEADFSWKPQCVYSSHSTGDLLVGMHGLSMRRNKVVRYSQSGILTQTIQHSKKKLGHNCKHHYITENSNGDIVVSDLSAVVVTDRRGKHRFTYGGHPSGSELWPYGLCTDALSNILVCDGLTNSVHMINKDGQFVLYLLRKLLMLRTPYGLSYDNTTHSLWVGLGEENKACVYRYIQRQDRTEDLYHSIENEEQSFNEIQITKATDLQTKIDHLLKMFSDPELLHSFTLPGFSTCAHITCATSDRIWVSYGNNLIFTNKTGVILHRLEDLCNELYGGLHTVNNKGELIYIDKTYSVNKLSKDMKTRTQFIEETNSLWKPQCVYSSPSTGDLLVGMQIHGTKTSKVARYNQGRQLTQTIQHDNKGLDLYRTIRYISENINGDVVVSMCDAVVVTERGGRHRFSYTGHPSRSELRPFAICTDALSNILVCDGLTSTVHMIDKDGQFISYLLKNSLAIPTPHCLSYDLNTDYLWVGSLKENNVCVYRYIQRQDHTEDSCYATYNEKSLNKIQIVQPQAKIEQLHKVMLCPKLLYHIRLRELPGCDHITCVTSDLIWVSKMNNLILMNSKCITLHCLEGLGSEFGSHTVNSENELIYIDMNYNINKLSNHMKTITTFIERTISPWKPQCVFCSPSTGDLLIGMLSIDKKLGKVNRYNQRGKLIQTIQHNKKGLHLYITPYYITENKNGDVVVSDYESCAVVVTERGGILRFSYTGHPSGSELWPFAICTDALSNILVCDGLTSTVHMIDKDGQFIAYLLKNSPDIRTPYCLSYDFNTHCLLVGSLKEKNVCVYRYIQRQNNTEDLLHATYYEESFNEIQTAKKEKSQREDSMDRHATLRQGVDFFATKKFGLSGQISKIADKGSTGENV